MKFLFTLIGAFITLGLSGCASDSSSYQYQISAYQMTSKPVHVWYRPNINDFYSRFSKGYEESGIVELSLVINQSGIVKQVDTLKSSGYSMLDSSATDLAYRMVFDPRTDDGKTQESVKLFVNFHKKSITPPVKVINVTNKVELLTGFQQKIIVGAVASSDGFIESVFPLQSSGQSFLDSEVLGYASRYEPEVFPQDQGADQQQIKLEITFN